MCFRPRRVRGEPEVDLISPVDALLVILIFLMIMTTYSRHTRLKVNLSITEVERATERLGQIAVPVTANGIYSVDRQVLDIRDVTSLADTLRNATSKTGGPEPIVIVNADIQATHQAVANIMEATRVAGLSHLAFTT